MAAFMKLGDIKGEFAPSRQVDRDPGDNFCGNTGDRTNWDAICDIGTSIKQTSVADALTNYRLNGDADHNGLTSDITVDPKTGDKLGPVMDPIIDPNETYDVAIQSLIDDMMTGFMKLDDIRGEFSPSRQADGVLVKTHCSGMHEGNNVSLSNPSNVTLSNPSGALAGDVDGDSDFDSSQDVHDHNHGNRTNWDAICDVGTAIKQSSVSDALTDYRLFSEMNQGDPFSELDQGVFAPVNVLRSDNRFVFEPLNAMTSFGDSLDPGLDGANGFKPREVAAVEIGRPPDPKLWLHTLG